MKIKLLQTRFWTMEVPLLASLLIICLVIGSLLDRLDRARFDNLQREKASQFAIETFQVINNVFSNMSLGLGRLVAAAELVPDMTTSEFEAVARRMLEHFNSLEGRAIDLEPALVGIALAPELVVRHVYPLPKNRDLVDLDYRDLPDQLPDVLAALSSQNPMLSKPFVAVQGQRAIAIRAAVHDQNGNAWGLATVVVDLDALFDQLVDHFTRTEAYRIGIAIDGFGEFGDVGVFELDPLSLSFQEQRLGWSIAVVPFDGWPRLPIVTVTWISTAIGSVILLMSVHFLYSRSVLARQTVERLKSGIDALSAGFVITDADDRLILWNETYTKIMRHGTDLRKGMTLEEMLRNAIKKGTYLVPESQIDQWIERLIKAHRRAESSLEVELADGRWIKTLSRRTADGDVVGVRFDITDLKRARITAERMSAAKSEFISVLSHELRTPLTTILGFGRLLRARPADADVISELLPENRTVT